jgi:hypothetical protein
VKVPVWKNIRVVGGYVVFSARPPLSIDDIEIAVEAPIVQSLGAQLTVAALAQQGVTLGLSPAAPGAANPS